MSDEAQSHPAMSAVQQELSELVGRFWLENHGCAEVASEVRVPLEGKTHVVVDACGVRPDGRRVAVEVTLGRDLEAARGEKFLADVAKLHLLIDIGIFQDGVLLLGHPKALQQATSARWAAFAARRWGLVVEQATLTDEQAQRLQATADLQGVPEANTRRRDLT